MIKGKIFLMQILITISIQFGHGDSISVKSYNKNFDLTKNYLSYLDSNI